MKEILLRRKTLQDTGLLQLGVGSRGDVRER